MKRLWTYAIAFWVILAQLSAFAQEPTINLTVEPGVIRLNESATLKLNFINLNPPQAPGAPEIPGFSTEYIGQESQFQTVNGEQTRRMSYNYRLVPRATGKFPIGPFTMNIGSKTVELNSVTVEVLPASGSRSGGEEQTMQDLVFARLVLPREKVYVHEQFIIELMLYYRGVQLDRGIQLQNLPSTGLNLDSFDEIGSSREVVNNELYQVRRFRMRGTAISAGAIELMPSVRVNVLVRRDRGRDPFFSGFFGMRDTEPLSVPAEPVSVEILPLPAKGKPENFSGAVGKFNMGIEVSPRECSAGDPVTLTMRLTGDGNFESIAMPALSFGDQFRAYDPKLMASGRDHKIYEQVFIPRTDTITEIPEVSFTYFDPEAGAYKAITKGPIPLTVKPGTAGSQQMIQAPSEVAAVSKDPLGIDIIDLKRETPAWTRRDPGSVPGSRAVALHVLPVLAIVGLAVVRRQRERLDRDVSRKRRSLAPKSARAGIREAEEALERGDSKAFHEALWQAMADYFGHRANLEPGEVSPDLIRARAGRGGLPAAEIEKLGEILDACEASRFASLSDRQPDELKRMLNSAQEILRACERIDI